MSTKIKMAAAIALLAVVAVPGISFAQQDDGSVAVSKHHRASHAATQNRSYDRALGGAYGAAPGYFSQERVYAPDHYQSGSPFTGVDRDFQMQRSD
jgi:hypothetical protein